jgi:hypothetical protein
MNNMKEILLLLSSISSFSGYFIGVHSVMKGDFKPQRMTRIVILLVVSISTLSLFLSGERAGLFLALAQLIGAAIFLLLSIKYGVGGTNKLDLVVLFLAIFTIILWKVTTNSFVALCMAISSDFIGMIPTLFKAYKQPITEEPKFYMGDFIAGFLNLLALTSHKFSDLVFPGYIFLINGFLVAVIVAGRKKFTRKDGIS